MLESKIIKKGENFKFLINGKEFSPIAYITYFEENNDFKKFSDQGYKLFSVNISFSNKAINSGTGIKIFTQGVFDVKDNPDYACVHEAFDRVLEACPEAYIFPRVYVTMPDWWIDENETEVVKTVASGKREALYSEKFREDGAKLLKELIDYIENSKYADRVFAYHISGGNTQEWFHFDLNGGYCENALKYFNKYLRERNLMEVTELPLLKECESEGEIEDELLIKYLEFANESVADTIEHFCKTAKETLNYKKIVGSFYGYNLEVMSPLWGTHKLSKLLSSKNVDFFSSPNSYNGIRSLGYDWGDMMPNESIKLHGKLPFMENDIRTHLTKYPADSRKGCDPERKYDVPVFKGPETEKLSLSAVNKSFARQITHKNGLWWFDMFGHWYNSPALLKAAENSLNAYNALDDNKSDLKAQVAMFTDENISSKFGSRSKLYSYPNIVRNVMIQSSVPFDIYLLNDFKNVLSNKNYKAFIFISYEKSELYSEAKKLCEKEKMPYMLFSNESESLNESNVRKFLKENGVHTYTDNSSILYVGNGYLAIHAINGGEKEITLPHIMKITDESGNSFETDKFKLNTEKFDTRIFKIE